MVVIRMRPGRHGRCQVVKSVRQDGTHKRLDELCFVDPRDGGECLARPRTLPLLARRCPVTKSFGKEVKEGCGTPVGIIGQILLPCRPPVEPVAKWPWWVL